MFLVVLAALHPFVMPTRHGLFEASGLYLVRVTAVEVPDHPKRLGDTRFRIDEVLIGPSHLKDVSATYKFFTPSGEFSAGTMGGRYSGKYPDFAYPTVKGQARYWWASADGPDRWKTADFRQLARYIPPPGPELLLKVDLKPDSKEAAEQKELVKALVALEARRTWVGQIALLKELQKSSSVSIYSMADRTLAKLTTIPKPKK